MRLIFALVLAFTFCSATAQTSAGIQWIDNDITLAKKRAADTGKLLFVYGYTTWCGPCVQMKKSVFPSSEVGDYYNKAFVNVKMNLEEGDGPQLSQQYQVQGYPTFLWLDSDGKMIHRSMGGRNTLEFLELGMAASDPDQQISTMAARYEDGERAPAFLKQYAQVISESIFSGYEDITKEYLATQSDWTTPDNMKFLFDYSEADINSDLFRYTLDHRADFAKLLGQEKVEAKIAFAAERDRSKSGIARDDVDALKIHYSLYYTEDRAYHMAMQTYFKQLMYSPNPVEQEQFKSEIPLYLADMPDHTWNFYNAVAWQLYEVTDDSKLLTMAAKWTKESIRKNSNYHNNDTMAHIMYKLGDVASAKLYAESAIALAETEGLDTTETQKLMKKLY